MLFENSIYVPDYQRAYSWGKDRHVKTFLTDLQDYIGSKSSTPYYFGHFLFEERDKDKFGIIDGQQRLTTITIFLAALFRRLEEMRNLTEEEQVVYEGMVKCGSEYCFSTVGYDNLLFKDYVIDRIKKNHDGLDTESQKRIVSAYDFPEEELSKMDEPKIVSLLDAIKNASCTTHIVKNEAEAIQMFIFQNNRGKKPTNLEIIKAQFLYNVHLYGGAEKEKRALIGEIRERFEKIYRSIATLGHRIDEDDVLTYTLRVYCNSLWANDAKQKVDEELGKEATRIDFIKTFTEKLTVCFDQITTFFKKEKEEIAYHSLFLSGHHGLLFPFMIKAMLLNVSENDMLRLAASLESIFVRARVIGTRADLTTRLNDVFQVFVGDVNRIIERIDWMKKQEDWWGYWNNTEFERSLQGGINQRHCQVFIVEI